MTRAGSALRYPLGPLLGIVDAPSITVAGAALGVHGSQLHRWQRSGLSEEMADRLACRAGHHPGEIWPEWWNADG